MLKVSNLMHNQIVGQHVVNIANFFVVAKRYPGERRINGQWVQQWINTPVDNEYISV